MKKRMIMLLLICCIVMGAFAADGTYSPQKYYNFDADNDRFTVDYYEGHLDLTFYNDNIVHFLYYPKYTNDMNIGWGIKPPKEMVNPEGPAPRRTQYQSKAITVKMRGYADIIELYNNKDEKFLTWTGLEMKPTVVYGEDSYQTSISFAAPEDEHYYGLGQRQNRIMDHRGKTIKMHHDYHGPDYSGEIISIPFMLTNKNYAIVYDNPGKSWVDCAIDGKTTWRSETGEAISLYIIYGETIDEIYKNYGELCGSAPLPPKKAFGYIQCKQKYKTQEELTAVAKGYVDRDYPIDYVVLDWYYWNDLGNMDISQERWPDAKAMNQQLEDWGIDCMLSLWPRFKQTSTNYGFLDKNRWLMKSPSGKSIADIAWTSNGYGGLIDSTNPDAAKWYWEKIRDNYVSLGFDAYWLDSCEPEFDLSPFYLKAGLGAKIFNIYPYLHSKGVYEGHRRDLDTRAFILTRSGYLGSQTFGSTMWSSDIGQDWDSYSKQIATGVNICASGIPYWSSDIGGWKHFYACKKLPEDTKLLITADLGWEGMHRELPELYTRWFQYGSFCPMFRTHGTRPENEVWSYGPEIEKILVKYLNLRYDLMPYIYSNAWQVTANNSPFMRGLFLDFMNDENVLDIKDEYLFGRSLLVAPVLEAGQDKRDVYLPSGADWYDFWTNKKYDGGQKVTADCPIDTMPIFVKAGSIVPKANNIKRADAPLTTMDIFVYPGADAEFIYYDDATNNYDYETGQYATVKFVWNDAKEILTIEDRQGEFDGMVENIELNIIKAGRNNPYSKTTKGKTLNYSGKEMIIKF